MKIIFYLLFLLSILMTASYPTFAQQNRWVYVGEDTSGALFYLNKTSRQSIGKTIKVWDKIVYRDNSYRINQTEWKCKEKQFAIVDITIYSPNNEFISKDKPTPWLNVVPDSISEIMHKAVCGNLSDNNSEKTSLSKKMAEIIVEKANVRTNPDINSTIIRKVKSGERFALADENPADGWYQIIISGTNTGWIHGSTIKLVEITDKKKNKKRK
jgi:uncharacterized protein YgiM (DUF1202 family)